MNKMKYKMTGYDFFVYKAHQIFLFTLNAFCRWQKSLKKCSWQHSKSGEPPTKQATKLTSKDGLALQPKTT